ncbi:MAG: hypothetical protein KDD44_12690, partial [Bdellovibrionales bacterium]|nr:hypothetical protein [Bdellovibrionales bacterium]
ELEEKFGDDVDTYEHSVVEALEASIESVADEQDVSTNFVATMLSALSEALEQLDPSAFDGDEDEEEEFEYEIDEDEGDIDLDDEEEEEDDDLLDMDEEEEEDEEDDD